MDKKLRKSTVILLVEDDEGDQEITRRAFEDNLIVADLRIVSDGEEALEYLFHTGRYADVASAPRPDLILLDLNLPRVDGREVLSKIRENAKTSFIPVVILTTSTLKDDVLESYKLNCNSYITKRVNMEGFVAAMRNVGSYWLELVSLPR